MSKAKFIWCASTLIISLICISYAQAEEKQNWSKREIVYSYTHDDGEKLIRMKISEANKGLNLWKTSNCNCEAKAAAYQNYLLMSCDVKGFPIQNIINCKINKSKDTALAGTVCAAYKIWCE